LLHIGICRKSFASQVLLKRPKEIQIAGSNIRTAEEGWASNFCIFEPLKEYLVGKRLVTENDAKQAVIS
jgi:hypothetical protein